jgi:hypothetical protein
VSSTDSGKTWTAPTQVLGALKLECETGNNIEAWNRVSGTGGRPHCKECEGIQDGTRAR